VVWGWGGALSTVVCSEELGLEGASWDRFTGWGLAPAEGTAGQERLTESKCHQDPGGFRGASAGGGSTGRRPHRGTHNHGQVQT